MKAIKIFVVDDDPLQLEMITDHLGQFKNYICKTFYKGETMLASLGEKPDIIVLDYNLSSADKDAKKSIDILKAVKSADERIEVIIYSRQDNVEVAMTCMRFGAFDYVVKNPTAFYRMENIIHKIIKQYELVADAERYKRMLSLIGYVILALAVLAVIAKLSGLDDVFNILDH